MMFSILKHHLVASKCQDQDGNCEFCFSSVWYLLTVCLVLFLNFFIGKEVKEQQKLKNDYAVCVTRIFLTWQRNVTVSMLVLPTNELSTLWKLSSFLVPPFPIVWGKKKKQNGSCWCILLDVLMCSIAVYPCELCLYKQRVKIWSDTTPKHLIRDLLSNYCSQ